MNSIVREVEERNFSIEDIVTYSNIEITHANDNKIPRGKLVRRLVFWGCIVALCGLLIFY